MDFHDQLLGKVLLDYQSRRAKNPAFSLRAYARFLGIPPSGLSDIFNGKRKISRKMGNKIASRISIPADVSAEISRSLKGKYSKLESGEKFVVMERETFEVISNWHYFAIISLSELDHFVGKPKWISKHLGISEAKAKSALDKLVELGLLKFDVSSKRIRPTNTNFATTTDIPNLAIRRSLQEHLDLSAAALESLAVDHRDFGFINIATDPALLAEAKRRIRNFRRELCSFLERADKKSAVFRLGTQLFPLTKQPKGD